MDRQTERQTDLLSRVSMLTRDKNCAVGMLMLTTDKHEALRGLSVTAELLVLPTGKVWTSAAYMSQTRDQLRFTISEVAADWHEPMVPLRIIMAIHFPR